MFQRLTLLIAVSSILINDSASIRNIEAFVSTAPSIRITITPPSSLCHRRVIRSHPTSSRCCRGTTRLFLEIDTKDENNERTNEIDVNSNSDSNSALVTNAKDGSNEEGDGSFVNTFLASFPELSFWNVANTNNQDSKLRKRDLIRSLLRRSANLSLQDYNWRSDYFKKTEADRRVEESMARMMGEDAAYVRPMDATDDKIGPLGRAERKLVLWLSLVIEEEGRRAQLISTSNGDLIRPIDLQTTNEGGPLSALEYTAVSFLDTIRSSEEERAKTLTLRPKDLEVVRPIDVPGPLGELERWYVELFKAELQRARDAVRNDGRFGRPKDIAMRGPMGDTEQKVSDALNVIRDEETERLRSMRKVLMDNRPMERDRESPLGVVEAVIVGIYKGPQLIFRVIDRVNELMQSSTLWDQEDEVKNLPSVSSATLNGKKDDDDSSDDDDDDDDNRD